MRALAVALLGVCISACASGPSCREHGWVGGCTKPVERCGFLGLTGTYGKDHVHGLPAALPGDRALLVTSVPCDAPLARAGVRPGDLLCAVDGMTIDDPSTFRDLAERKAPGSAMRLSVWRDGGTFETTAVVGRERYRKQLSVGIGAKWPPVEPTIDLWPGDGRVTVLGLVDVAHLDGRCDLACVERTYLQSARPGRDVTGSGDHVETTSVHLFPLTVAVRRHVLAQESVDVP